MWYSEEDLKSRVKLLKETVQYQQKKALTIAVIGQHGCGKSSFINTIMAALGGKYHEHATVGKFEEEGEHMTRRLIRYPNKMYIDDNFDLNYPTLVDMIGFQNSNNKIVRETLDLVFNGCIKDGTKLNIEAADQRSLLDINKELSYDDENSFKVDRVLFVASASSISKEFPTELIRAVKSQTMDGRRDIPLFGVLTHADEIDEKDEHFLKLEEKFKNSLGITNRRYLLCSSYCDEIPSKDNRNPNVEVPVMDFIMEVMDHRKVFEDQNIFMHIYQQLKLKTIFDYVICVIIFVFHLLIIQPCSRNFMFGLSLIVFLFIAFPFVYVCVNCLSTIFLNRFPKINKIMYRRVETLLKRG